MWNSLLVNPTWLETCPQKSLNSSLHRGHLSSVLESPVWGHRHCLDSCHISVDLRACERRDTSLWVVSLLNWNLPLQRKTGFEDGTHTCPQQPCIRQALEEDVYRNVQAWEGAGRSRGLRERPSTDQTQKVWGAPRLGSESIYVIIKGNRGCIPKPHTSRVHTTNKQMEVERPSFLRAATVTQEDKSQGQLGSAWPAMPQKTRIRWEHEGFF